MRWLAVGAVLVAGCGDSGSSTDSFGPPATTTGMPPTTSLTSPVTSMGGPTTVADTSGTGSGTGVDTTGEPACEGDRRCVAVAPEGWEGPVALQQSAPDEPEPNCGVDFLEEQTVAYEGIVAPDATCTCSCGPTQGTTCANSATLRYYDTDPACSAGAVTQSVFDGSCNAFATDFDGDTYWQVEPVIASGGFCVADLTQSIDDAQFGLRLTMCGGAETTQVGCANDELCAPMPGPAFGSGICVWRTEDHECPDGYPEKRLLHTTINDQRGCNACSCDDPLGLCDEAVVGLRGAVGCFLPETALIPADESCVNSTADITRGAIFTPGEPNAFCTPSAGTATGEATLQDPVTVCCG